MSREVLTTLVAICVLIVWVAAAATGVIEHDYTLIKIVSVPMLGLAGYAFGTGWTISRKRENGNNKNGKKE